MATHTANEGFCHPYKESVTDAVRPAGRLPISDPLGPPLKPPLRAFNGTTAVPTLFLI